MGLLWEFRFDSFHEYTLIIRNMVERKTFLANPNHQYRVSQYGEHDCSAQSQKEWRLLQESKFDSFYAQTLILGKMVERKTFLAKPKHQCHVSQ